jgi:hypothetical protein
MPLWVRLPPAPLFNCMEELKLEELEQLIESIVKETLDEMPIRNFQTVGDFSKRSSFKHDTDRKILTSPGGVQKIKRLFEKTPYNFNLFFVNSPKANKAEMREVGVVTPEFIKEKLGVELPPEDVNNGITVVFTGNSAADHHMMTAWVIAHRIGHAIRASNSNISLNTAWNDYTKHVLGVIKNYVETIYDISLQMNNRSGNGAPMPDPNSEKVLLQVMQQMGSFKSARDSNIRSYFEFFYEVFAQYLITGKVKFRPFEQVIATGVGPFGRKQFKRAAADANLDMHNRDLEYYESEIESMIDAVLEACVGRVFLM